MDEYLLKKRGSGAAARRKLSPVAAFISVKDRYGLPAPPSRFGKWQDREREASASAATTGAAESATKKRKETSLAAASTKARKLHDKEDAIRKTRERNGMVMNSDGTMTTVARPWERYEMHKSGCCNAKDCKATSHNHTQDRTIIGQLDYRGEIKNA